MTALFSSICIMYEYILHILYTVVVIIHKALAMAT